MKRLMILVLALAVFPLTAETLTRGERDFAMSNLHASRKMFLDAVSGLSEAQWMFKPAPDRWSVADCAEHITLSEDFLLRMVTEKVMKSPATARQAPTTREEDEAVVQKVVDRSRKATAPEALNPTGRWPAKDALIQQFKESRDRTISFVENTQEDLRSHLQGKRDAYQWLLFLSGHTERHVAQINEVKADPNFPKK